MVLKEYTYRGKKLDELKQMTIKEFAALLPARERRSLLRGFTADEKKCYDKLESKGKAKTHSREMVILPGMVGKTVGVHNGKGFVNVTITEEMIGNRFGQYALTRKMTKHSASKAAKGKVSVR
jgi:small subunit ribosomal protein S19